MKSFKVLSKKFDYLLITNGIKEFKITKEAYDLNKKLDVNLENIKILTHHKNYIRTFDINNLIKPKTLKFKKWKKLNKLNNLDIENIVPVLEDNSIVEEINKNIIPHYYLKKTVPALGIINFFNSIGIKEFNSIFPKYIAHIFSYLLKDFEELNTVFINNKLYKNKNPHFKINILDTNESYLVSYKDNFKSISNRNVLDTENHIDCIFEINISQNLEIKNYLPLVKNKQNLALFISNLKHDNTMNFCCSFDHRVIDGALGARILKKLGNALENPIIELI